PGIRRGRGPVRRQPCARCALTRPGTGAILIPSRFLADRGAGSKIGIGAPCLAAIGTMELDLRKQALLQAIVDTYVRSAEPVGSEWLAAHQNLGVRSATIRNEMAELTELGLLRQPHTSAGRVPSDQGYRYYVDRLMNRRPLPAPHVRPLRELGRLSDGDVEELLRQTCRVLSSLTRYTSVAAPPVAEHPRIRQVHLAKMSERQLLLVVVLDNGC